MAIFRSDGVFGLPRLDKSVYPVLDVGYELVVGWLLFQFTPPNTTARAIWLYVVIGHGLLMAITDYGEGKSVFGIKTSISICPLWIMSFYDMFVFSCLFFASAYEYLHGMCHFAGLSGEQWAFFLLCNEPLNILQVPNITYPWQKESTKNKKVQ